MRCLAHKPARVAAAQTASIFRQFGGGPHLPARRRGSGLPGLAPFLLLLAACGSGQPGKAAGDESNEVAAEGLGTVGPLNEAEAAALADEAAADEAADTNAFGGNAAAGETGNASRGMTGNAAAGGSGNAL
jgi:hypothetical protein